MGTEPDFEKLPEYLVLHEYLVTQENGSHSPKNHTENRNLLDLPKKSDHNSKNSGPTHKNLVRFRQIPPKLKIIWPSTTEASQIPENIEGDIKILTRFIKSRQS